MTDMIQVWQLRRETNLPIEPVRALPEPKSLDEATHSLPSGAYTTFRTFDRFRVLRLADHYSRLEETARLAGVPIQLDSSRLASALRQALAAFPADEMRVRVILDLEKKIGDIYVLVEPLHTPDQSQYRDGVRVLTRIMQRENPQAKLTGFIYTASVVRQDLPREYNEILMIGQDGSLLEGLSSNFFGVIAGTLYTADVGVLSGITRRLVLEEIRQQNLPLRLVGVPAAEVGQLEEAFITSASRAVLPVVEIDGKAVAGGRPGPITRRLLSGYLARVQRELDTL